MSSPDVVASSLKPSVPKSWPVVALFVTVYAGLIGGLPGVRDLQLNVLIVGLVFLGVGVIAGLVSSHGAVPVPSVLLVLVATCLIGLAHAPRYDYAHSKRLALGVTLLAVVGGFWLVTDHRRRRLWLRAHLVIGAAVLLTAAQGVTGRLGENTIATGRAVGSALVILLVGLMAGAFSQAWVRVMAAAASVSLCVGLFATGSRGPALSVAIALVIVGGMHARRGRWVRVVASLFLVWLGYLLLISTDDAGAARIQGTLTGRISGTGTRTPRWAAALHEIPQAPFGIGWGNFRSVSLAGIGDRQYPHNVVLECAVEAGWLAGAAMVVFIVVGMIGIARLAVNPQGAVLLGLAIFLLANGMVSGDINDNRPMWTTLAIGVGAFVVESRARTRSPKSSNSGRQRLDLTGGPRG